LQAAVAGDARSLIVSSTTQALLSFCDVRNALVFALPHFYFCFIYFLFFNTVHDQLIIVFFLLYFTSSSNSGSSFFFLLIFILASFLY
jgi:hypothetical protein